MELFMQLEYFHPMFVHFPVALTLCGTGLLAFGALRGRGGARRAGLLVLVLAGAMVIPTYITGQVARAVLEDSSAYERDLPLLDTHEDLGLASLGALLALGIVAGLALARENKTGADGGPEARTQPWGLLLLALAASALIGATAFYGGRLVFEHGIGVRHRAQESAPTQNPPSS